MLQAPLHGLGRAPGNHRDVDAGAQQVLDADAVADADRLDLEAVRPEVELAVGHDAVDVQEHAADFGGTRADFVQAQQGHQTTPARSRSCMWMTPHRRSSASATSSAVILCCSISRTASAASH